jgi:hypothetical protein
VQNLFIASLMGNLFYIAWSGFADDLLEARRRYRILFAIAGGLVAIGIAVAEIALMGAAAPSWMLALQSSLILAIFSWAGYNALVLGLQALSFGPQRVRENAPGARAREPALARSSRRSCPFTADGRRTGVPRAQPHDRDPRRTPQGA